MFGTSIQGSSSPGGPVVADGSIVARSVSSRFARVRDVRDFGAIGDGASHPLSAFYGSLGAAQAVFPHAVALTDEIDWAATQAAINASGTREVVMPRGKYIWNRPIVGVPGMALVGDGVGTRALTSPTGTIIDATALSAGTILDCTPGGAYGVTLEDFFIEGATGGTAIVVNFSLQRGTMRRLGINRGRIGMMANGIGCVFEDVWWDLQVYQGVQLYQGSKHRFRACSFANATGSSSSNMYMYGNVRDVRIEDSLFDEAFSAGSTSCTIAQATDVTIRGCRMYNGVAYGLRIGEGAACTRVTVEDFRTDTFSSSPTNTILIEASAVGTRLINVTTNPGAGGDISDLASDTTWLNVNGLYKMPSLRTTDPGAGSKQLWCDTTDLNRVKFRT